jgi:hypothetical protein
MGDFAFQKVLDLGDIPPSWSLVRLATDWNGFPILLFVEGKPPRPDSDTVSADPWTFTRWYQSPPKAHHALHFDGNAISTVCFEQSQGLSTFHVQRFEDGWLLADRRGGCGNLHDRTGRLLRSINLGDASEDIQTTPDGRIWVSYFDEGVFGGGIGKHGVVCFDGAGNPKFKYAEFAEQAGLPSVADCYAMNAATSGDVWLNYYTDFPLVHLCDFALDKVWMDFGVLGNEFAVRNEAVVSTRKAQLELLSLRSEGHPADVLTATDDSGAPLVSLPTPHIGLVARGPNLLLNTGSAVYISVLPSAIVVPGG